MTVRTWAIAAAFLVTSTGGSAAPEGAPERAAERIKADVTYLADDLMEGRNTGTRGYDLAAAFVASRYAALGLQAPNDGSYYQRVPFVLATLKQGTANEIKIGGQEFANGADVVLSGTSLFPKQAQEAEVVFVGYGFENKRYGFDDYKGLDVRGKVVAVLQSLPGGAPSDVVADLGNNRAELAESKGAIGMIIIPTSETLKQTPWDQIKAYASVPRLRWVHPDGRPNVVAPKLAIGGFLGPKAAEALLARTPLPYTKLNMTIADKGARPKGFAISGKIRIERHSAVEKMTSPNVLGLIPGSDPHLADEVILLTAHLDHDGIVEPVEGDAVMNGAMDNASGVAVMLEAARAFVESGRPPKRSIMFAAVTAEEDGLLGAEYLAKYPVMKDRKIVGVINLDMPILTYDFQDVIAFGAEHSTMGPAVDRALASSGIKQSPDPMPEQGLFTRSDHYMFVKEGIPAIFLATGWAGPGKAAVQSFLSTHYHQVSDAPTLPFNWTAGAKFARLNYLIARELADGLAAPRWYEGSYFADKFAKYRPKAKRP